jgi:hypothetical protein
VETRKLAAILCSDVVGYSKLAGADEDRILARLRDGGTLTEVARVRPCWRLRDLHQSRRPSIPRRSASAKTLAPRPRRDATQACLAGFDLTNEASARSLAASSSAAGVFRRDEAAILSSRGGVQMRSCVSGSLMEEFIGITLSVETALSPTPPRAPNWQ